MLDESVTTAVKGFTDANPVLGGVIVLCLVGWGLTYRVMNGLRLEERQGRLKAEADRDRTIAEQREDYRDMRNVTKAVEDLQAVVREAVRK